MSGTDDLGRPVSYLALAEGTAVLGSDGDEVGHVAHVLADEEQDIFDGIVIAHRLGHHTFADAEQVAAIHEHGVTLTITAAEAEALPEPSENPAVDAGRPGRAGRPRRWATSCAARGTCSPATTERGWMKAIVWHGPQRMAIEERPEPGDPGAGELIVRPEAVGICGSEVEGYLGHMGNRTPPLVMGHEFAGVVVAAGDGAGAWEGTRVAVNPLRAAARCRLCRAGQENLCPRRTLIGVHHDGAFADLVHRPGGQRARAARRRRGARRRARRAVGQRRARGPPRAGRRSGVASGRASAPARSGS